MTAPVRVTVLQDVYDGSRLVAAKGAEIVARFNDERTAVYIPTVGGEIIRPAYFVAVVTK